MSRSKTRILGLLNTDVLKNINTDSVTIFRKDMVRCNPNNYYYKTNELIISNGAVKAHMENHEMLR